MDRLLAIDAWTQPNTIETCKGWPPDAAYIFKKYNVDIYQPIPVEEMLAQMDEAGIEKAVLSALLTPEFAIPNAVVAKYVAQYPNRFIGQACVDPRTGMKGVRELDHFVREYGFKALKIEPFFWREVPSHKMYYPLYAKCVELDIAVTIQVGHTGPLYPSETGRPGYIDEIALFFPELRILAGHIGWPWTEEMIAVAWKHANVYIDTSAHLPKHYPPEFVHFMKTFGQDKVIWASDWPLLPFKRCLDQVEALPLDPAIKRKFLRDNVIRALKL